MLDKLKFKPITVLDDYSAEIINEHQVLLKTRVTEKIA